MAFNWVVERNSLKKRCQDHWGINSHLMQEGSCEEHWLSYYVVSRQSRVILLHFFKRNDYCRTIGFLSFSTVAIMFYLCLCTSERELVSEEGVRRGKYLKWKCLKIMSLSSCTLSCLRI